MCLWKVEWNTLTELDWVTGASCLNQRISGSGFPSAWNAMRISLDRTASTFLANVLLAFQICHDCNAVYVVKCNFQKELRQDFRQRQSLKSLAVRMTSCFERDNNKFQLWLRVRKWDVWHHHHHQQPGMAVWCCPRFRRRQRPLELSQTLGPHEQTGGTTFHSGGKGFWIFIDFIFWFHRFFLSVFTVRENFVPINSDSGEQVDMLNLKWNSPRATFFHFLCWIQLWGQVNRVYCRLGGCGNLCIIIEVKFVEILPPFVPTTTKGPNSHSGLKSREKICHPEKILYHALERLIHSRPTNGLVKSRVQKGLRFCQVFFLPVA